VHDIVTPDELGGDVFLHVKVFEMDVVGKQVLSRRLMQSNIETIQAFGIWVVFGSL